ncbi:ABC transporter substrate-binding protein [Neorhizobium petrolearium]|uniref:ABC transporter substrate-binding protein n=1 Tax=Neorhizobium petrolearium TaxID=515361 RepID=A0ABY8LVE7_9HYPH|nr:ABC transporter substrate-binding protein [Neorhizobium petrolearium]MCC2611076.1 ABC transporter substrate-binding protein [Neorhizobium petrolearium]WGI66292.1 ABC transporter substrate-binding protein [Neorhizobium petrolearium]
MKFQTLLKTTAVMALLAATAGTAIAQDKMMRVRINADIRSTDPGVNRDANSDAVVLHMVEGLVGYKDDASIAPLLAKSVDISADGKTYTFKLRDGLKFSNGEPLTSADVLASWQRYVDPKTAWRCLKDVTGSGVANVTNVTAPDASSVVFTLEKPTALFLTTLARTDCGGTGIYHKSSLDTDGKWVKPIGTGPFMLNEWRSGQYVELAANPNYVSPGGERSGYVGNKTPKVPAVRFMVIPDDAAAKAALYSGDIDVISDVNNADVEEFSASDELKVDKVASMGLTGLLFQTRDPLLKDVRIRKALLLTLDLPQIAEALTNGQAPANLSVIPVPSPYSGKLQKDVPARDLEAAKTLLAQAGYKGQPIKWLATKFYPSLFDAAVLVQAMAQEAGINIEIETLDWATLLDRYTAGNYSAMSFTYSARLDPSLSFDMVSGNKDKSPNKVWDNPEGLKLIAESTTVSDSEKRQVLFDKLEGMIRADVPLIPLYSGTRIGAVRANVDGYKTWPVGYPRMWGVSFAAGK